MKRFLVSQSSDSEKLWDRKPKTQDASPRQGKGTVILHCDELKHLFSYELATLVRAAIRGEAVRIRSDAKEVPPMINLLVAFSPSCLLGKRHLNFIKFLPPLCRSLFLSLFEGLL